MFCSSTSGLEFRVSVSITNGALDMTPDPARARHASASASGLIASSVCSGLGQWKYRIVAIWSKESSSFLYPFVETLCSEHMPEAVWTWKSSSKSSKFQTSFWRLRFEKTRCSHSECNASGCLVAVMLKWAGLQIRSIETSTSSRICFDLPKRKLRSTRWYWASKSPETEMESHPETNLLIDRKIKETPSDVGQIHPWFPVLILWRNQ